MSRDPRKAARAGEKRTRRYRAAGKPGDSKWRLTALRVAGMRTLLDVRLELGGLTVLIGDNGTGKSSILEACEILRRVGASGSFVSEFSGIHGFSEIARFGERRVSLAVEAECGDRKSDYQIVLNQRGIEREVLTVGGAIHLDRSERDAWVFDEAQGTRVHWDGITENPLLAAQAQVQTQTAFARMTDLLKGIEVHVPFNVTARWIGRETQSHSLMRLSSTLAPAPRLSRLGANLANSYQALKNRPREHWEETIDWVRLGLGPDVDDVTTEAQPGGGGIALELRYKTGVKVPAYCLSDGELAYLSFVAVFRLEAAASLLAIDEPENHLHPELLARVVQFMESATEDRPVMVATHSDRLLDCLSDSASGVVLCDLDENRATRLLRPDPGAVAAWLERYRGVGDVRSAGHQWSLFRRGRG